MIEVGFGLGSNVGDPRAPLLPLDASGRAELRAMLAGVCSTVRVAGR